MVETAQLTKLVESADPDAWAGTLFSLAHAHGFDKVCYGLVPSRHAKLENAFMCSNFAPKWRERYTADRLAYVDPTVSHCLASTLPLIWAPGTFRAPGERELYEEACGFGIRAGVTLPVHGPNGEFGVISFVTGTAAEGEFHRAAHEVLPALALVRDYVFASSARFCSPAPGQDPLPRLTRRELEVLNWAMAGKSSWEISKITSCSEATVNFHMANVRQKFNVNTRQQAVVKAIALGLITPEDHHR
jgi:LuxR family quorum-sensing transcriptional regulator LasR